MLAHIVQPNWVGLYIYIFMININPIALGSTKWYFSIFLPIDSCSHPIEILSYWRGLDIGLHSKSFMDKKKKICEEEQES